jgi:hypothetical protein
MVSISALSRNFVPNIDWSAYSRRQLPIEHFSITPAGTAKSFALPKDLAGRQWPHRLVGRFAYDRCKESRQGTKAKLVSRIRFRFTA